MYAVIYYCFKSTGGLKKTLIVIHIIAFIFIQKKTTRGSLIDSLVHPKCSGSKKKIVHEDS